VVLSNARHPSLPESDGISIHAYLSALGHILELEECDVYRLFSDLASRLQLRISMARRIRALSVAAS
jgi:hypothetical protein